MKAQRLPFIDALRVLAFFWLVAYHVGMYYVSWDWHIKSPQASTALEPWMMLSSPWRMSLLFVISGVATGALLRHPGARLRQRLGRLLKPLLLGVVLIVPPQSYLEVGQKFGWSGSYADFLSLYFRGYHGFCPERGGCLILPTWNHLWFLPYLALYTAGGWLLVRRRPGWLATLQQWATKSADGPGVLVMPVGVLLAARWLLPWFPPSHALVDDLALHAQYLPLFLLGMLWSGPQAHWARLATWRHLALGLMLCAWAVLVVLEPSAASRPLRGLCMAVAQWCGVLAALGYGWRHLNQPHPWMQQVMQRWTPAVFPLYLVHQTVIMLAAAWLAPYRLPVALEAPLLLALTLLAGWLFYRAVRRVAWLRPWCGLSPLQPKVAAAASIEASRPA